MTSLLNGLLTWVCLLCGNGACVPLKRLPNGDEGVATNHLFRGQ